MSDTRTADARVLRVVNFFEQLSPTDLTRMGEYYAADASFNVVSSQDTAASGSGTMK